jgi:transposase InsO family protein
MAAAAGAEAAPAAGRQTAKKQKYVSLEQAGQKGTSAEPAVDIDAQPGLGPQPPPPTPIPKSLSAEQVPRWERLRAELKEGTKAPPSVAELAVFANFSRESTRHLSDEQQAQLDAVMVRVSRRNVFAFDGRLPKPVKHVRHHIDVGNARPARAKMRRYSIVELEALWKELDKLIRRGVVEPASSPWNSPLLLVPKPDGRLRVVQDLRAVNKAVMEHGNGQEGYPLPRIDELLESLDRAGWFSSFDAMDGFWQVELDKESRPVTAFTTRWGQYQWVVGTMGLARMPATFQRMFELAVGHDVLWAYALVYIDDLLIFSRTFEEHLVHVETVLTRLASAGVMLKPSKCSLAQRELRFLGHHVSGAGRRPDPGKVAAVQNIALPKDVSEARSFLQLCSYYRDYIPHFSDISEPLNALLRKDVPFVETDEVRAAWLMLKSKLMTAPLLAHPDYKGIRDGSTRLVLQTDASDVGIAGVLSQQRDGAEQPLAYFSRSLKGAERNYSTYDREALAVVESVQHFRPLLHNGHGFRLETDHAALKYLLQPSSELRTKRQERYVMLLQEYDMDIVYRAGHLNGNADTLSRLVRGVWHDGAAQRQQQIFGVRAGETEAAEAAAASEVAAECAGCAGELVQQQAEGGGAAAPEQRRGGQELSLERLSEEQRRDGFCGPVLRYVQFKELPVGASEEFKMEVRAAALAGYYEFGGVLYCGARRGKHSTPEEDRVVVPQSLVGLVMRGAHDDPLGGGHVGFVRTYAKLAQRYFWRGMYSDVAEWVLRCPTCLARKLQQQRGVPVLGFGHESISHPFEFVGVDVVGPFPPTERGNRYVVVFTDYLTRWVEAFAVVEHTAESVAELLINEVVARHGAPRVLLSDNGPEFRSKLLAAVTTMVGVGRRFSSPYHPQCNGLTERANGSVVALLSVLAEGQHREWDRLLPKVLLSHRASVNSTLGVSPFRLLYGREPVLPFETALRRGAPQLPPRWRSAAEYVQRLEEQLSEAHMVVAEFLLEQQLLREAAAQGAMHQRFAPGDLVWVHRFVKKKGLSPKLQGRRWFGPYRVERRVANADTYVVRPEPGVATLTLGPELTIPYVHAIRMRKYNARLDPAGPVPLELRGAGGGAAGGAGGGAAAGGAAGGARPPTRQRDSGARARVPLAVQVAQGGVSEYTLPPGTIVLPRCPERKLLRRMRGHAILQVWKFDEGEESEHTQWCEGWIVSCPNSFQHAFLVEWRDAAGHKQERTYTLLRSELYSSEVRAPANSWFIYGKPEQLEPLLQDAQASAQRAAEPTEVTVGEEPVVLVDSGRNAGASWKAGMAVRVHAQYLRKAGIVLAGEAEWVPAIIVHVDPHAKLVEVVCPASFADHDAFEKALPRFLAVYRGERLPHWREWLQRRVSICADDEAIMAAAAQVLPHIELWVPVDSWALMRVD